MLGSFKKDLAELSNRVSDQHSQNKVKMTSDLTQSRASMEQKFAQQLDNLMSNIEERQELRIKQLRADLVSEISSLVDLRIGNYSSEVNAQFRMYFKEINSTLRPHEEGMSRTASFNVVPRVTGQRDIAIALEHVHIRVFRRPFGWAEEVE